MWCSTTATLWVTLAVALATNALPIDCGGTNGIDNFDSIDDFSSTGYSDAANISSASTNLAVTPQLTFAMPNSLPAITPTNLNNGALRFVLPYAQAPIDSYRFANPQPIKSLPRNFDPSKTPASCYQDGSTTRNGNTPSEDCLYLTTFVPKTITPTSNLPIYVWLPGGSLIGGSASAAGLDGSVLAAEQNVIVVVAQYRLGLFGWLQSSGTLDELRGGAPGAAKVAGNQGARDVVAALQFIKDNFRAIGGDTSRITLAGHSSGAQLVRSLLTTPAAQPLFSQALIVSDPQNYGMAKQETQNKLGSYGLQQLNCSDIACARSKSAEEILDATYDAYYDVPAQDGSVPSGSPWRPVKGAWITDAIETNPSAAFSASSLKKVIFTTIANEAGSAVGNLFAPTPARASQVTYGDTSMNFGGASSLFFNNGRGDKMASAPYYSCMQQNSANRSDGLRGSVEAGATDGLWRCSTQRTAVSLAQAAGGKAGSQVWLAQHLLGSTYVSNTANSYCRASSGRWCHEDDLYMLFGNLPKDATPAQVAVSRELRARYGSFIRTGDPNAKGYAKWSAVDSKSGTAQPYVLRAGSGANGSSTVTQGQRGGGGCSMWGSAVQFDWQMYG